MSIESDFQSALQANALLIAENRRLKEALKSLLDRAVYLDQSVTHDGLTNCNAISAARMALADKYPLPDVVRGKYGRKIRGQS